MTLETAKRVLEEVPQDDTRFQYRMKNYSRIHEAEAVCRGGFTYCEHEDNGGRRYVYLKVFPTPTDSESSIEQALELYRSRNKKPTGTIRDYPKPVENRVPVSSVTIESHEETEIPDKKATSIVQVLEKWKRLLYRIKSQLDEFVQE